MRSRPRSRVLRTSGSRKDGGRTYPARHARPLPADPPGQPCTVPVYDPASAPGGCWRSTLTRPAATSTRPAAPSSASCSSGCGARYVADVSPSGGRHVSSCSPRRCPGGSCATSPARCRCGSPSIDPAPMSSLGGQISPPGARHKSGGWRVLSMPLERSQGGRRAPERAGGMGRAAGRVRGRAAARSKRSTMYRVPRPRPSWTTPASRGCPASAAAPRSALSLSTSPAPGGGTGHATRAAARRAWPSWAPLQPAAGGWPRCESAIASRSLEGPGRAVRATLRARPPRAAAALRVAKMRRQDLGGGKRTPMAH